MTTPALAVQGASVSFSGVTAVEDVTFEVLPGVTTAIIGPNGAGKTTLLNLICGLERGAGRIHLGATEISELRADRRAQAGLARSFQTPILCDDLSVLDNIRVGAPRALAKDTSRIEEQHSLLQIEADLSSPARNLTHRDRRMTEIARALLREGTVLVLDEPAAGLSQAEADAMMAAVLEMTSKTGKTVVIIEHNMDLVSTWAAQVIVLNRGRLLTQGTPQQIRAHPDVVAAYLGGDWQ